MSQVIGTATLSLDDDGFLRRECPECERECKWLHSDEGDPMPTGGYHCPYCDAAQKTDGGRSLNWRTSRRSWRTRQKTHCTKR